MASLSRLPNELIAETWGHVLEPKDIESFALVSKKIYAIGIPFIMEHNRLKREFSFFETGPNTRASAPAFLLKNVLLRPRVALYVTHLSLGRHQDEWQPPNGDGYDDMTYSNNWPKTRHDPYSDDDMALFIKAIRKTSFLSRDEVEKWIPFVREGDEDEILALLLLLLPNLTTITLNNEGQDSKCFRMTIQRIALDGQQSFLTRLKTVCLQGEFSFDNDLLEPDWLEEFYRLPLLHAIHSKSMGFWTKSNRRYYVMAAISNITELTFVESLVPPKTMFRLLESIKALKEFSYVEPEPDVEIKGFDPFWIRAALLAHAKHSLESLTIVSCRIGKFLGTFRHFTALRELETNIHLLVFGTTFEMLTELLPDSFEMLTELLPASIEQLHLHMGDQWCYDSLPPIVKSFAQAKSQLFPNFRALKLSWEPKTGATQADKDLVEISNEMCWAVGIELTVTAGLQRHTKGAVRAYTYRSEVASEQLEDEGDSQMDSDT